MERSEQVLNAAASTEVKEDPQSLFHRRRRKRATLWWEMLWRFQLFSMPPLWNSYRMILSGSDVMGLDL